MTKNKQKKVAVIDEYYNPIFRPSRLVVCKHVSEKALNQKYCYNDDTEIVELDGAEAWTIYGCKKKGESIADIIIIYLNDCVFDKKQYPEDEIINLLAHEALHYAFRLGQFNSFHLDESTNEVFANLVGYAAQCAYKTYKK